MTESVRGAREAETGREAERASRREGGREGERDYELRDAYQRRRG